MKTKTSKTKTDLKDNLRTCLITRKALPKEELLRFVISDEGDLVFDLENKLPGRGFWLLADKKVLQEALLKKPFHTPKLKIEEGFEKKVEERLLKRILSFIGLAKKSGVLIAGFDSVKINLIKEKLQILFLASDGAENGQEKVNAVLEKMVKKPLICSDFSSKELAFSLNRDKVVYMGVTESAFADSFEKELNRYHAFLCSEHLTRGL
ncbi:MAG: DUF448 domain-containing protein [Alphaproteobacteria bacterium]|nr:DUF448 domain-containing protein [Alphaproteobacteria bacterium]